MKKRILVLAFLASMFVAPTVAQASPARPAGVKCGQQTWYYYYGPKHEATTGNYSFDIQVILAVRVDSIDLTTYCGGIESGATIDLLTGCDSWAGQPYTATLLGTGWGPVYHCSHINYYFMSNEWTGSGCSSTNPVYAYAGDANYTYYYGPYYCTLP
jgi:hypothetical protein